MTQEPTNFDGVLWSPPYSAKWSASSGFPRIHTSHPIWQVGASGQGGSPFSCGYYRETRQWCLMAIVASSRGHRGNARKEPFARHFRRRGPLIQIISLPANVFFNTSIPTTVIILKRTGPIGTSTLSMLLRNLTRARTRTS